MTSKTIHIILGLCTCWILVKLSIGGFSCLSSPCINGICIDDLNSTYSCYCIDGFTGIQCQTNWNECWSSPCKNGGTCIDGIASYNCTCIDGFLGDDCEINYDECISNPCLNNGTCIDVDNGYSCLCTPGYEGVNCEVDIAVCNITGADRCANGGVCIEGRGFTFYCDCTPGWNGPICEDQINECDSAPCQNGGICIDLIATYTCACHFGYTGSNCEESILLCNDNPCENDALCLMEDDKIVCYCVPDYHGDRCQYQYDECQLGPRCMNGGTCIDGVDSFMCSCPPDLTGVLCECLILPNETFDCTYILPTIPTPNITYFVPEITIPTSTEHSYTTTFSTDIIEFSTVPKTYTSIIPEYETTTLYQTEYFSDTIVQNITTPEFGTSPKDNSTDVSVITVSPRLPKDEIVTQSLTKALPSLSTTLTDEFITTISQPLTTTREMDVSSTEIIENFTSIEFYTHKSSIFPETEITTFFKPKPTQSILTTSTFETVFLSSTTTDLITTEYTIFKNRTPSFMDCTKNYCQNGGSCILKVEGPKCVCKFNYEGNFCEIELIIQNAAFMGMSYLTHHIDSKSSIQIELRAKTLATSGLIFYSNLGKTAYMSLYIMDELLKFQFSCGLQTMVLCEMDVMVNNGHEFKIQAHLEYSKNRSHCNATVRLNDTITMSGDQTAVYNVLDVSDSWLHFGKILQHLHNQLAEIPGFIGCIHSLKINDISRDIFKDAQDGFEISDCNSLACLSNPCSNNGICIENDGKWSCLCTNGFVGQTCIQSICENNPCMYGASCVPYTSGFLCLCQFGKHGYLCEQDLEITEPSFSSTIHGMSSFSAHTISKSIANNMEIEFSFVPDTIEQISLLLFIGQDGTHDVLSDHLAVSFVKGYIMLTWNLGSGPRRIFTTKPLTSFPHKEHTVRVGRLGRRAWITVDNIGNVTGRSPGKQEQLDVQPIIYLGGYDKTNFSTLPHDLPLHTGFSGCIFNVFITVGDFSVPLLNTRAKFGRSVGQCKTSECTNYVCQNGGVCLQYGPTFTCLCADGWFGHFCTIKHNPCDSTRHQCSLDSTCVPLADTYECDCPLGKSGKFCEKHENLSDVHFSGKRSYLTIHLSFIMHAIFFDIEMQVRPLSDQGLICFMGDESKFIALYLQGGVMEFRLFSSETEHSTDSHVIVVRSRQVLRIGEWYTIKAGKQGKKVYIETDDTVSANIIPNNNLFKLNLPNALHLGGLPDLANLPRDASPGYPTSFSGCIRQLKVNDLLMTLNTTNVYESRNIDDCDGTPCGGDICLNGGTCWLDSHINPHCSCSQYYSGENCQNKISCQELNCHNEGRCVQDDDGVHKCTCPLGWMGDFCENTSQPLRSPYLMGSNSYIMVENKNKKRNRIEGASYSLQNIDWFGISYIHINFSTPEPDGMLLWTQNGFKFFGIGMEQGILKITWQESDVVVYDISAYGVITDGAWHSLTLMFDYGNMTLFIDEKEIQLPTEINDHNLQEDETPFTNGIFYVGGFPDNQSIIQETNGIYLKHFKGCISELSFEKDEEITDFSIFPGQHVDKCYITP